MAVALCPPPPPLPLKPPTQFCYVTRIIIHQITLILEILLTLIYGPPTFYWTQLFLLLNG